MSTTTNLAVEDYLSLAGHPLLREAALRTLRDLPAGRSALLPCTTPSALELEGRLARLLGLDGAALFASEGAAALAAINSVVGPDDRIAIDRTAASELRIAAAAATPHVERIDATPATIEATLRRMRRQRAKGGILVVAQGLAATDARTADVAKLQGIAREYDAQLLLDVRHDLGAIGPNGTGAIGLAAMHGRGDRVDRVIGTFSCCYGAQGAFVASRADEHAGSARLAGRGRVFPSGLPPVQTAVALEALRLVHSDEGERRRALLRRTSDALRSTVREQGGVCLGDAAPMVPVLAGDERCARLASWMLLERRIFANAIEHPTVPRGAARVQLLASAGCPTDIAARAARATAEAIAAATRTLRELHGAEPGAGMA